MMPSLSKLISFTFLYRMAGVIFGGVIVSLPFLFFTMLLTMAPMSEFEHLAVHSPLPHHVPEHQGGLSLRFAMVHDVIHERFARHGVEYFEKRNERTREKLDQLSASDLARWPLIDDLCVGLERLGETEAAIPLMQEKLDQQQTAGLSGIELYTSYANLGTFLVHANFQRAQSGDAEATEKFADGIELVRKATEVNPGAHFGRERWQLKIGEFLLAAFEDPELLRQTDFIGNPLDDSYEFIMRSEDTYYTGHGKASRALHGESAQDHFPRYFPPIAAPDDPDHWEEFRGVREHITRIGPEDSSVPFDEPMLGIIGMWREGGGANPHFSLALAETMLRVGQRYIAWAAYERTKLLKERYSPDPELQQFLNDHCEKRHAEIEASFQTDGPVLSPALHPEYTELEPLEVEATHSDQRRQQFEDELAFGEKYQREYQQYEADQIRAGVSLNAPDFYDSFLSDFPAIATTPGREEMMYYVPTSRREDYLNETINNRTIFGAGLGALFTAIVIFVWDQFFSRKQAKPE